MATGNNDYGQCNVEDWEGIVEIVAGSDCTIGLKADGTVVATGNNEEGQCEVENWKGIDKIFMSEPHGMYSFEIQEDGTVVSTVEGFDPNGWKNLRVP